MVVEAFALTLKHVHWNVVGPNFIAASGNRSGWSSTTGSSAPTWKPPTAR
jgi:hypothetical protein